MARNAARPLSPHLTIWKWGPHMLVSILHRATGTGLAIGGGILFAWWLAAAAAGADSYARFVDLMTGDESGRINLIPAVVLIGLTWAWLQHMATGIRHFVLDTGAGYELKVNKTGAVATMVFSVAATAAIWGWLLVGGR